MKHRIALVIPYFGPWPEWINFTIESCRTNSDIDWFVIGDSRPPENRARNVHHVTIGFEAYKNQLSQKLELAIGATDPYKLCDLKPALPFVHADLVGSYDFVGFGDLDVIYGDIRRFYDREMLERYDLLSTHRDRISGHFCMFRNSPQMVEAFKTVAGWKEAFATAQHIGFDEREFFNAVTRPKRRFLGARTEQTRCFLHEAYGTPGAADRMCWFWKDGVLTNEFYPQHPFLYLHFMSWHSNRWYSSQPDVAPGASAPWQRLPQVVQMDWRESARDGFMISPAGIQPIERPNYR